MQSPTRRVSSVILSLLFAFTPIQSQSPNAVAPDSPSSISVGPAEAWVARLNLQNYDYDRARAIATDDSGNIYVTGASALPTEGTDIVTIKYNAAGVIQWDARYNTPSEGNRPDASDDVKAIAVDALGNVYVTGWALTGSSCDYVIIKYNHAGVQQWVARYNGPENSYDAARALAVDGYGNVFVTGVSISPGTHYDYATIKYNSKGVQQWVARYDYVNSHDEPSAVAVDRSGNVYVTGMSRDGFTHYATVKYNAAGVMQWVRRYTGVPSSENWATALVVDRAGNVYVTGSSGRIRATYVTIKYNTAGTEQWVARYESPKYYNFTPAGLVVDGLGNVYVTGYSQGVGADHYFATIKYNSAGAQQWLAEYISGGGETSALAVDDDGNIYVAGHHNFGKGSSRDYSVIKYNGKGIQQWVARYDGKSHTGDETAGLAIDRWGNLYVTGYSTGGDRSKHIATVKFNRDGFQQWADLYRWVENNDDQAVAAAVDEAGNIYVTGSTSGTASRSDYATIKYNRDGVKQWIARYDYPYATSYDVAKAVAVDRWGNVYVTGHSIGAGTQYDFATVKHDRDGVKKWAARYNGKDDRDDGANAIAVDTLGNVYVTGFSISKAGSPDYATIKYNGNGVRQWIAFYDGPGKFEDRANALTVDGNGNVYVTGRSAGTPYATDIADFATVKYNSTGVQQWVARYPKTFGSFEESNCIAVDRSGNVYVGGYSNGPASERNFVVLKYDSVGTQKWSGLYHGPVRGYNAVTALVVDDLENVYVTGRSEGTGTGSDYVTLKYDKSGRQLWAARYNGPRNADDLAVAIGVDAQRNVYVTGSSAGAGTVNDFATIKYSSAGKQQWVARYNGPANRNDAAAALIVDRRGDVIVAGSSAGAGTLNDFLTIKYFADRITAGCSGKALPDSAAYGNIKGGDQSHPEEVAYCFPGQTGDLFLSFQAYDIGDSNEVRVLLNGVKVYAVPATTEGRWSGDFGVLLPDSLIKDGAGNALVFDNTQKPPQTRFWGVRRVTVQSCFRLPSATAYGKIPAGDQRHPDKVVYRFSGRPGALRLNYEAFDINDDNEAAIWLNGVKIHDIGVTAGGKWSGKRTLFLPDSLVRDAGLNLLIFDNNQNPPLRLNWGVKNISVSFSVSRAAATTPTAAPANFYLAQNFPNPFNPTTTINFALPEPSSVKLTLYDAQGRLLKTMIEGKMAAGYYDFTVDAGGLPSGILFYRLEAGVFLATQKMILIK